MKLISAFLLIFIFNSFVFTQERLSIEGYFQGNNVYIENPANADGFGFCINKISVNGDLVPAATGNEVVAINLKLLNLKIGSPVLIIIYHESGCKPMFINPEVLRTKSTFKIIDINIDRNGKLEFKTINEQGKLPFLIEQYKWDKWVKIGEISGNGSKSEQNYSFLISPHSGENKIRISQIDNTNSIRSSKTTTFLSKMPEVYKSPTKVKTQINFYTAESNIIKTRFEIFDAYGNILKKGYNHLVDCSNLVNGLYYINYDNKTEKFIKN